MTLASTPVADAVDVGVSALTYNCDVDKLTEDNGQATLAVECDSNFQFIYNTISCVYFCTAPPPAVTDGTYAVPAQTVSSVGWLDGASLE